MRYLKDILVQVTGKMQFSLKKIITEKSHTKNTSGLGKCLLALIF